MATTPVTDVRRQASEAIREMLRKAPLVNPLNSVTTIRLSGRQSSAEIPAKTTVDLRSRRNAILSSLQRSAS